MKKLLSLAALTAQLFLSQNTYASDMYIKMEIFSGRQTKIYDDIVSHSGLAKSPEDAKKDNYHLTLGQVVGANKASDAKNLRKFLVQKLNAACAPDLNGDHAIILGDVTAGRYTVNRNFHHCPLVLFPDQSTTDKLKAYNLVLNNALAEYNRLNATSYKMGDDVTPANYTPHITLANTHWIDTKCKFTRDQIIPTLNKKIVTARQKDPKKTYNFMLKVPEL